MEMRITKTNSAQFTVLQLFMKTTRS